MSLGYIDGVGKYRKGKKALGHDVNPTYKRWSHELERKQFAAEIIQPHYHGKPNKAFIEAYPEVAKDYWSQEVIDEILRELP